MRIILTRASSKHHSWIKTQLQIYLAELSQYAPVKKNKHGLYLYPYLEHYWREPDRHAFVIEKNDDATGFLLVRKDLNPVDGTFINEIAELYILPAFRQHSVATCVVKIVLSYFFGNWRVAVFRNNPTALSFWRNLIPNLDPNFTEKTSYSQKDQQIIFTFNGPNQLLGI